MYTHLRFPSGNTYPINKAEFAATQEGYPPFYIQQIAKSSRRTGISISRLGIGDRELWLTQRHTLTLDIDGEALSYVGTATHAQLLVTPGSEIALDGEMTGHLDHLECLDNGTLRIWDMKVVGGYSIRKFLGYRTEDEPTLDSFGHPVLLKSGKNKGQPKTHKVQIFDPSAAQTGPYTLQLNGYRVLLETLLAKDNIPDHLVDFKGMKVSQLRIFFITRDGKRGASYLDGEKLTYVAPVALLPDEKILKIMKSKLQAMQRLSAPGPCTPEEAWEGRKCTEYCPVAEFCKVLGNPYLQR